MRNDRIEELLLLIVAVCMLSYLLPFSLLRNILVTIVIACALIGLLLLRSLSWREERTTPFDGVLVVGIALLVIYLITFYAFEHTAISAAVVSLFAVFYVLMAVFLSQYRWPQRRTLATAHTPRPSPSASRTVVEKEKTAHTTTARARTHESTHVHDAAFMRGVEPIHEHEPPRSWFRRVIRRTASPAVSRQEFRRGLEPIAEREPPKGWFRRILRRSARVERKTHDARDEHVPAHHVPATRLPKEKLTPQRKEHIRTEMFRRGLEPIHEMRPPTPAKMHDEAFARNVEPIAELKRPRPAKKHGAEFAKGMTPVEPLDAEPTEAKPLTADEIRRLAPFVGKKVEKTTRVTKRRSRRR